ncbi:hypothetical protein [Mycobacterium sp. 1081908.1]|uniref:hypothetical protein n=1 Tax=Mycobacterium sp. 1081908.1 TaxID=1834066 RepID=UPI000800673B|nr:hypothetical protein [Mycobacterium sp. 1081908.1]OBK46861.1 hypothetical protein A5655_09235 [Mycobacterium sp. 1081908.1]
MTLRDYEQRYVPELQAALGEPILRAVPLNGAGVAARTSSLARSAMFWRPYLLVDGRPYTRLPFATFLTLTPTRVVLFETKRTMRGSAPLLDAPVLTLQRDDADITATQGHDQGRSVWRYRLRSRASTAELELELRPFGGIAAELAGQLRDFCAPTAPSPPRAVQLPPGSGRGQFYWDGHGWSPRPRHRIRFAPWMAVAGVLVVVAVAYSIIMKAVLGHGSHTTWTPPPTTPASTTSVQPMGPLICKHTDPAGAPYYVQLINSTESPGTCTGQPFTQEEFQAIHGLTLQCVLDSDVAISQMHGIASIFSDDSQSSINAAKLVCTSNGH